MTRLPTVIATLLALLIAAALLPAAANGETTGATAQPEPQTNLADLEDEVMCPICGTLLGLAEAPQAQRQRVLIRRLIDEGRTKDEIKQVLVDEYGPEVLPLPEASGFSLTAYLVPIAGFLLAMVGLAVAVWHWRKAGEDHDDGNAPPGDASTNGSGTRARGPTGPEAERLDADLARYDL